MIRLKLMSQLLSTIMEKLKCGTFVQVMSPPVQAGDRTRRAVRYGGRDGYVTTVGNLGSVYCKERYALVHEAAKTKIAEDHIEEHAIAVEEDALEQKISNATRRTFRAKTYRQRAVAKDSGAIGVTKKTGPRRSCVDAKIRFLQSSQSPDMLIPKAAFTRLIRELVIDIEAEKRAKRDDRLDTGEPDNENLRMSTDALSCLQFAAECFLVDLFSDMNKLGRHAKRATVMVQDLDVLCVLSRKDSVLQSYNDKKQKAPVKNSEVVRDVD